MQAVQEPGRRSAIVVGVALVLFGVLSLIGNALSFDLVAVGWPIFVIAAGVILFALGIGVGGPAGLAFAIPGGIVSMAGIVLAFQNATGLWATWAYAWALVAPGGVGLGMVLYGLLTADRGIARAGLPPLLVGLGLFLGFGLFFEGFVGLDFGRIVGFETLFAAGFILLGVVIIAVGLVGRRSRGHDQATDITR